MAPARIVSVASSVPPLVKLREIADFCAGDPGGDDLVRIIEHSAIETKGMAVNPLLEDPRTWATAQRTSRSVAEAEVIGADAIRIALNRAGVSPDEVGLLATSTTTALAVPGLGVLAERTGMPGDTERLALGPMACHSGLPSLAAVRNWVEVHERPAVLLCAEVCSTQIKPPPYDKEKAVVLTLFGDGAAAVVVRPGQARHAGLDFIDRETRALPEHRDAVRVSVGDSGLDTQLSHKLADIVSSGARSPVDALLARNDLDRDEIVWWAVHPGGRRIVERVANALQLPELSVETSLGVMRDYGNVLGATVLMVVERLSAARPLGPGEHGVALAFGPGATIWTALFRGA